LILSYGSKWFDEKLSELKADFMENNNDNNNQKQLSNMITKITLNGANLEYLDLVFNYMYTGRIELTLENSAPLLFLAKKYGIKDLGEEIVEYIVANITRENALLILQTVIDMNVENVITRAIQIIARNFLHLTQTNPRSLHMLPVSFLIRLIKRNNLAVPSELVVYQAVCNYIEANQAKVSQPDIESLFQQVRFPFLSFGKP
jgi:hypothetical protein